MSADPIRLPCRLTLLERQSIDLDLREVRKKEIAPHTAVRLSSLQATPRRGSMNSSCDDAAHCSHGTTAAAYTNRVSEPIGEQGQRDRAIGELDHRTAQAGIHPRILQPCMVWLDRSRSMQLQPWTRIRAHGHITTTVTMNRAIAMPPPRSSHTHKTLPRPSSSTTTSYPLQSHNFFISCDSQSLGSDPSVLGSPSRPITR